MELFMFPNLCKDELLQCYVLRMSQGQTLCFDLCKTQKRVRKEAKRRHVHFFCKTAFFFACTPYIHMHTCTCAIIHIPPSYTGFSPPTSPVGPVSFIVDLGTSSRTLGTPVSGCLTASELVFFISLARREGISEVLSAYSSLFTTFVTESVITIIGS